MPIPNLEEFRDGIGIGRGIEELKNESPDGYRGKKWYSRQTRLFLLEKCRTESDKIWSRTSRRNFGRNQRSCWRRTPSGASSSRTLSGM